MLRFAHGGEAGAEKHWTRIGQKLEPTGSRARSSRLRTRLRQDRRRRRADGSTEGRRLSSQSDQAYLDWRPAPEPGRAAVFVQRYAYAAELFAQFSGQRRLAFQAGVD